MADNFDISSPLNPGSEVYQTPKGGKAKLVAAKAKEDKKKKQAVPQSPPMPGAGSSSASGEPRRIEADLIAVGEVEEDKMERERPNGETEPGSQEIERKDQDDKEDTPDAYGADDEDEEEEEVKDADLEEMKRQWKDMKEAMQAMKDQMEREKEEFEERTIRVAADFFVDSESDGKRPRMGRRTSCKTGQGSGMERRRWTLERLA